VLANPAVITTRGDNGRLLSRVPHANPKIMHSPAAGDNVPPRSGASVHKLMRIHQTGYPASPLFPLNDHL